MLFTEQVSFFLVFNMIEIEDQSLISHDFYNGGGPNSSVIFYIISTSGWVSRFCFLLT